MVLATVDALEAAVYRGGSRPLHPEERTLTGTTILALDLGKDKCVSCAYDQATTAAEFRTITTSRAEVERLIRATAPAVVVIEACTLAGWVHDLCGELGVPVKVANTAAEAWKYKHTRRKTDRDDALRLAQLEALGRLPTVVVPAKRVREWRALIAPRQALVAQRVAAQNRIRAVLVGQGLPAPVPPPVPQLIPLRRCHPTAKP